MKDALESCIVVRDNKCYHVSAVGEGFEREVSVSGALKILQEKMEMTQAEFAEQFCIPVSTYAQWTTGRRTPPLYVVDMLSVSVEKEIMRRRDLALLCTNASKMSDTIRYHLTRCKFPFRILEKLKVVATLTEAGERKYYLTAGEIRPDEIPDIRHWLEEQYDAGFANEFDERIADCDNEADRRARVNDIRDEVRTEYCNSHIPF